MIVYKQYKTMAFAIFFMTTFSSYAGSDLFSKQNQEAVGDFCSGIKGVIDCFARMIKVWVDHRRHQELVEALREKK